MVRHVEELDPAPIHSENHMKRGRHLESPNADLDCGRSWSARGRESLRMVLTSNCCRDPREALSVKQARELGSAASSSAPRGA